MVAPGSLWSQNPLPCWSRVGGHSPTVPWEPWCAGPLYQTTTPQAHCEAQPTAKPLEASPLALRYKPEPVQGFQGSKAAALCTWGIPEHPLGDAQLMLVGGSPGTALFPWFIAATRSQVTGLEVVGSSVPPPAPWLGKSPATAPAWLRDIRWVTAPRQDSCCRQTRQQDGELICDQDRKPTAVRGKIRRMTASPLSASHGL